MQSGQWKWAGRCGRLVGMLAVMAMVSPASAQLVISQVYGQGGGAATQPNGDFVELFNRGQSAIDLDPFSVQVADSASTLWSVVPLPSFNLQPGQYFLVRLETQASGTAYTADVTAATNINVIFSTTGKAAIVSGDTALTVACPPLASVVDFVRYEGTPGTNCTEGLSALSTGISFGNGRGIERLFGGCQDTDVNRNDFAVTAGIIVPRNSGSPLNVCAPIGACTQAAGPCTLSTEAACETAGGNYLGDGVPCPPNGACCLTDGSCFVTIQTLCEMNLGFYRWTAGGGCTPNLCSGRCCNTFDGTCTIKTSVACSGPNESYAGDGTACTPATVCSGRCCLPSGTCLNTGAGDCAAQSGAFSGVGTVCSANGNECKGRCCAQDGTCSTVGPADCVAPSVFAGLGTACSANGDECRGRCCNPDGSCVVTGPAGCVAPNRFGGLGTVCVSSSIYTSTGTSVIPGTGAATPSVINVPDNFSVVDANLRVKIQHTFRGDLILCVTNPGGTTVQLVPGASCTPAVTTGGACSTEDNFNAIFDDEGVAIVCTSVNLASLTATPDLVIPTQSLSAFDGLASGGAWTLNVFDDQSGDSGTLLEWALILDSGATPCTGACCVGQTCQLLSSDACAQASGTYLGDASVCGSPNPCAPNGACCVGLACSLQAPADCATLGGTYNGDGTSCANACGRCCLSGGGCSVGSALSCQAAGGAFTAGASCSSGADASYTLSIALPDNNDTGVSNVQTLAGVGGLITDVDVDVAVNHSFFGDLIVKVEHLGTVVTIVDQPGVPAIDTIGCAANNPDIVLDDEGAGGPVENLCSAGNATADPVPPSPPNYVPNNPLSAFDGMSANGAWTIHVADSTVVDTGTLVRWSLHITTDDVVCAPVGCTCRGDVNGDTLVNGKDIAQFAACVISGGGAGCACADVNNAGGVTSADIPAMISALLSGSCAP